MKIKLSLNPIFPAGLYIIHKLKKYEIYYIFYKEDVKFFRDRIKESQLLVKFLSRFSS